MDNEIIITNEVEFLDTLDVRQIIDLHKDKSTRDILQLIKNRYNQDYKDKYDSDFDLFYGMGERGFVLYVKEKFSIGIYDCAFYYFDC